MKFSSSSTSRTYSDRVADPQWRAWCAQHIQPAGKDVVDIGCGGGIYLRAFIEMGARTVVGVDGSAQYLQEAEQWAAELDNVHLCQASAVHTGLDNASADIVFERALIHHLSGQALLANALEAHRLLRAAGIFYVQDRTFEDVLAVQPEFWIRATLFELFPRLLEYERGRRPATANYTTLLRKAGFETVTTSMLVETRRAYDNFDELATEIRSRKGKSILFELDDAELARYTDALGEKSEHHALLEQDQWTVWIARSRVEP